MRSSVTQQWGFSSNKGRVRGLFAGCQQTESVFSEVLWVILTRSAAFLRLVRWRQPVSRPRARCGVGCACFILQWTQLLSTHRHRPTHWPGLCSAHVPITCASDWLKDFLQPLLDSFSGTRNLFLLKIETSLPYFGVKLSRVCLKVTYS